MNESVSSSLKVENLVYAYQFFGARNRERSQRQTVQNRENTNVYSYAQRDGHYSSCCKTRASQQRANTEANILKQLLQPHNAPHFPGILFDPRDVADLAQSRIACVVWRHSPVDVVLGFPVEMVANVLIEIRQHAFAACHAFSCSPGRRICAIARASLSHLPVSTTNCC